MQPNSRRVEPDGGAVDSSYHLVDEREEIAQRAIPERGMAFHGEIGGVDLKEVAAFDDGPVLDAQRFGDRGEVFGVGLVVAVGHGGHDEAGRGCGDESVCEPCVAAQPLESFEFGYQLAAIAVGDGPDRLRRSSQRHLRTTGTLGSKEVEEAGEVIHVLESTTCPIAQAEPAHPVLYVGEEALSTLLAVAGDVDADGCLVRDRGGHRFFNEDVEVGVGRLARQGVDEWSRAGQAARVGDEEAGHAPRQ